MSSSIDRLAHKRARVSTSGDSRAVFTSGSRGLEGLPPDLGKLLLTFLTVQETADLFFVSKWFSTWVKGSWTFLRPVHIPLHSNTTARGKRARGDFLPHGGRSCTRITSFVRACTDRLGDGSDFALQTRHLCSLSLMQPQLKKMESLFLHRIDPQCLPLFQRLFPNLTSLTLSECDLRQNFHLPPLLKRLQIFQCSLNGKQLVKDLPKLASLNSFSINSWGISLQELLLALPERLQSLRGEHCKLTPGEAIHTRSFARFKNLQEFDVRLVPGYLSLQEVLATLPWLTSLKGPALSHSEVIHMPNLTDLSVHSPITPRNLPALALKVPKLKILLARTMYIKVKERSFVPSPPFFSSLTQLHLFVANFPCGTNIWMCFPALQHLSLTHERTVNSSSDTCGHKWYEPILGDMPPMALTSVTIRPVVDVTPQAITSFLDKQLTCDRLVLNLDPVYRHIFTDSWIHSLQQEIQMSGRYLGTKGVMRVEKTRALRRRHLSNNERISLGLKSIFVRRVKK